MIAYIIQCFSHLDHIPVLLDWVSINPRSTDRFDLRGALAGRPNVHVTHSVPVTWCGESLTVAMLDGIAEALRVFDDWEYAINLSETCFPLQSQPALFDFLSAQRAAGVTEFLHRFGPVAPRDLGDLRVTHNFDEIAVVRPDTRLRVDRALQRFSAEIHDSPIVDADFDLRAAIHALEACPGEVTCRPLYRAEYLARQAFLRQWPLYMGRMWYAFSRRVCRWLVECDTAAQVFETMKSIYVPDECSICRPYCSAPARRWRRRRSAATICGLPMAVRACAATRTCRSWSPRAGSSPASLQLGRHGVDGVAGAGQPEVTHALPGCGIAVATPRRSLHAHDVGVLVAARAICTNTHRPVAA